MEYSNPATLPRKTVLTLRKLWNTLLFSFKDVCEKTQTKSEEELLHLGTTSPQEPSKSMCVGKDSNLATVEQLVLFCPCWAFKIIPQKSLVLLQTTSAADPFRSLSLCAEDCLEF